MKAEEVLSVINNNNLICLKVLNILGKRISIGIDAPKHIKIDRTEVSRNILNIKILIVEDDSLLHTVFKSFLQELNYNHIDIAATGEQALSLCSKNQYALIFLDIGLPGINGIEVCKKIRQQKKNIYTPIVAITAYGSAEQECHTAGFNDFAIKPVLFEKMESLLNRWLLSAL